MKRLRSCSVPVLLVGLALLLAQVAVPLLAIAHHDIGNVYHWQREENPFTLVVGDNLDPAWDQALDRAARDWSRSPVLDMDVGPGALNAKACGEFRTAITSRPQSGRGEAGRVEVCSGDYGDSGFKGITTILIEDRHFRKVIVALNDFYFDNPDFPRGVNNPHFRLSVMCHELGHAIGLDHVRGRGSCMTTSRRYYPETPDRHDYRQLKEIYAHEDDRTTVDGASRSSIEEPALVLEVPTRAKAGEEVVVKDLGGGWQQVTIIDWFDPSVLQVVQDGTGG